jgi:hypothetical protein
MGRFAEVMERCAGCAKVIKRSTTDKPKGLVKGKIVVLFCEKCQEKNEENKPPDAA